MDSVSLPPELERSAAEAVATGRYRDLSDVVQAGLAVLRRAEADIAEFVTSLEEVQAEGKRDGFLSAQDVHSRMNAMLDEWARAKV
jgi:putative addiction module CopG family antidote